MKFNTVNELEHFDFKESYLSDVQTGLGVKYILDQVKILPENSCNRDIRVMRTNQLELRITEGKLLKVVEEGNKIYDANGKLMREEADRLVAKEEYKELFDSLQGCEIFDLTKKDGEYALFVGGEEHAYVLVAEGSGDTEGWDRFLNLETSF